MFKKMISLIACSALLLTAGLLPTSAQEIEEVDTAVTILMNDEPLTETKSGSNRYTYIVASLENIPVLSCRFDRSVYSCKITQPSPQNGYIGTVILTSADGTEQKHLVRVYDNNTFKSHFINLGGDPWITYHNGWYYYMYTGNSFYISRSRELERANSNPTLVYTIGKLNETDEFNTLSELWAPELHFIDGYWYIYFTAYDNGYGEGTAKNHRMYVLKSKTADALGEYEFMGQIKEIESDYTGYDSTKFKPGHYAIDQSFFKWNDKLYAVWSGWHSYTSIGQRIYIAEMSDPCTISSARVELSRPEYAYETYSMQPAINEAPQAIISPDGSTLNITFSVNRFDDSHYSLGLLTLKENGDPLCADDWIKSDKAVFETNINTSTYSVGHCSFVPSPDLSEYYLVYHARRGEDTKSNPREVRVQQFYWNDDGTPAFDEALSAADPVQIPSGTAKIERTKLEAEDGELSGNAFIPEKGGVVTTYAADYYSGGKRVALTSSGSAVTFKYTAKKAGTYTLSLLAAGDGGSVTVTVNGTEYKKSLSGNASNINNFAYFDITGVELSEGENTITVGHRSSSCFIDRLDIANEADMEAAFARQAELNAASDKTPVIRKTAAKPPKSQPKYGKEYTFNYTGDFDKFWNSDSPFVPEYENTITTVRPGNNKRLFVTGEEFQNIADFDASLEVTPSTAHLYNETVQVKEEIGTFGVSTGIIFRANNFKDYTGDTITFSGYRCFLIVGGNGKIKMQFHQYYYQDENSTTAIATGSQKDSAGLTYTPGDTYVLEVSVRGSTFNATAYNKKDPNTTVSFKNIQLPTASAVEPEYSGRIGIYSKPKVGRVTVSNLKVTPYYSSASLVSDFGNLNDLSTYNTYIVDGNSSHTESNGIINIPTGVTKLILKNENAQNIADFDAGAKIKINNPDSPSIQAGFAFRVDDVTIGKPGITGYVLALQRTKEFEANQISLNLTKYGTDKNGNTNVNLGSQQGGSAGKRDTVLLSDITDASDISGLEFNLQVKVRDNMLYVNVSRVDNPTLSSSYSWQLDNPNFGMNKNYPVYYKSGKIGIFSNGYAQMSDIDVSSRPDEYNITLLGCDNGNAAANTKKTPQGEAVTVTLRADNGYYINPVKLSAIADNSDIELIRLNHFNETAAVYSLTMPSADVNIDYVFTKILKGDANCDEKIDVLDLVRAKKHLAQQTDKIGVANTDIDLNQTVDISDIVELKKLLLKN